MASIQCRNCKQGIHYHGEAKGIEYIVVKRTDWEKITSSVFEPHNKIIDKETGYPKLFRTDTIEEDFPGAVIKFWKCPNCGSLIFFDELGRITVAYEPQDDGEYDLQEEFETGWYFDDYEWDEMTESACPDCDLSDKVRNLNMIFISDSVIMMKKHDGIIVEKYRKII